MWGSDVMGIGTVFQLCCCGQDILAHDAWRDHLVYQKHDSSSWQFVITDNLLFHGIVFTWLQVL